MDEAKVYGGGRKMSALNEWHSSAGTAAARE